MAEVLAPAPASLPSSRCDFLSLHLQNSSHVDRRSMPSMGYMTHTVSAPSLHGKSVRVLHLPLQVHDRIQPAKGLISPNPLPAPPPPRASPRQSAGHLSTPPTPPRFRDEGIKAQISRMVICSGSPSQHWSLSSDPTCSFGKWRRMWACPLCAGQHFPATCLSSVSSLSFLPSLCFG